MKRTIYWTLAASVLLSLTLSPSLSRASAGGGMTAFRSDRELLQFLDRVSGEQGEVVGWNQPIPSPPPPPPPPSPGAPPAPPPPILQPVPSLELPNAPNTSMAPPEGPIIVRGSAPAPNITNRQEANVDEGGIVKVHGDHLVVLRRGRLFTISTANRTMQPVDQADAFPPGDGNGTNAYYDEMLISGDTIVVVGFNYARRGTEINRFTIGANGRLTYRDTHHLRSNDYYSSRNYASRLIGSRLIFYAPLDLYEPSEFADKLPALRRWAGQADDEGFRRLTPANRIYAAQSLRTSRRANINTIHSVTSCDLAATVFDCTSVAVLGSESRTFYVAQDAVYVWTSEVLRPSDDDDYGEADERSIVYRLPLNGTRPAAIGAWGGPNDQFGMRYDAADRMLNVLVQAETGGDGMWMPEGAEDGRIALLRLPVGSFGDGSRVIARRHYRALPAPDNVYNFQNRFVGRHLIYAASGRRMRNNAYIVHAVPLSGGGIRDIALPHGVTRLDVLGQDAVAIGNNADEVLGFSAIRLDPRTGDAVLEDTYLQPDAEEGETRSHAFFYRQDASEPDGTTGLLGLPVVRTLYTPAGMVERDVHMMLFLNRVRRIFSPAGELEGRDDDNLDDGCVASCNDWYGNARPIFLGDRIFALMGYELVEGRLNGRMIGETGRISFAPRGQGLQRPN